MSNDIKELNKELDKLLDKYDDSEKEIYKKKIQNLEKDCLKITKNVFPNLKIPIYMSIYEFDNPKPNSKANWSDTINLNSDYENLNDNYCRDVYNNENYVYPVRNPSTGVVSLQPCDKYINDELKEMLDLKYDLSIMISKARNALFRNEINNSNNGKNILDKLDNKLKEYEALQTQYLQTLKLINNFDILLKDKRKTIEEKEIEDTTLENTYNIGRDIQNDYNNTFKNNFKYNEKLIFYTKILLFITWCIALGLFSLININRIIK
jgi:hypothetical protein